MIKAIQIGLGPVGVKVVNYALKRKNIEIVTAVDPAPHIAGKDLGEVCSLKKLGITVCRDIELALQGEKPDVAILTTVSGLDLVTEQIEEIASYGLNIVTTCEELSYPWATQPELAKRIDEVCKTNRVTCLGTGVNPGFLMDFLPVVFSSVCQDVKSIKVSRIQDASPRRIPFQQKIGAGLTTAQFKEKEDSGTLRHVGLIESVHMIAKGLGWKLDKTSESLEPVIARHVISSGYTLIERGMACGVEQVGRGFVKGNEVIKLYFRAAVGEKEAADIVEIEGTPSFKSVIPGGVNGDIATCAVTLNAIPSVLDSSPGLKTMLDIRVPGFYRL